MSGRDRAWAVWILKISGSGRPKPYGRPDPADCQPCLGVPGICARFPDFLLVLSLQLLLLALAFLTGKCLLLVPYLRLICRLSGYWRRALVSLTLRSQGHIGRSRTGDSSTSLVCVRRY